MDIDQLGISSQCGFSSTVEGNKLTLDEQKAKLELIVEAGPRSGASSGLLAGAALTSTA